MRIFNLSEHHDWFRQTNDLDICCIIVFKKKKGCAENKIGTKWQKHKYTCTCICRTNEYNYLATYNVAAMGLYPEISAILEINGGRGI